jgi:hypothetical protein
VIIALEKGYNGVSSLVQLHRLSSETQAAEARLARICNIHLFNGYTSAVPLRWITDATKITLLAGAKMRLASNVLNVTS